MISFDSKNNIENLQSKNEINSNALYVILFLAILSFLGLAPFILLDVTSQNTAVVRSSNQNTKVQVGVSGKLIKLYIEPNNNYAKDDTLAIITRDLIQSSKNLKTVFTISMKII